MPARALRGASSAPNPGRVGADAGRPLLEPGRLDAPRLRAGNGGSGGTGWEDHPSEPCPRPRARAHMDGRLAPAARVLEMPGVRGAHPAKVDTKEVTAYERRSTDEANRTARPAGAAGGAGRG